MAQVSAIVSAVDAGTPTGFAGQYTSPGNIFVQDDNTPATATGAVQNSLYGNHYSLPSGWASSIPAGSTINSVTLNVRRSGGTNNRHTEGLRLDSVANTQIANELTAGVTGAIGTASFSAWSTLPTLAELQSTNFRVRSRTARVVSQTATYSLYWIEVVVDYTPPASTIQGAWAGAGAGALSGTGARGRVGASGLTGQGTLSADSIRVRLGAADLLGSGVLSGSGNISGGWGPPLNLQATVISSSAIDLSWDTVPSASGYDVERNGVVIATDVAGLLYHDTGLSPSTTYTYRVRAVGS